MSVRSCDEFGVVETNTSASAVGRVLGREGMEDYAPAP